MALRNEEFAIILKHILYAIDSYSVWKQAIGNKLNGKDFENQFAPLWNLLTATILNFVPQIHL